MAEGKSPDPQKTKAMSQIPVPTDSTSVQHFLGLASYYWRYIHHFSDITAPLNDLTRKDAAFVWDQRCNDALKQNLVSAPILTYPCFDHTAAEFTLHTDASAVSVGAVL